MALFDVASADEKQRVREIISRRKHPAGVDDVTVAFDIDQNGDTALWLIFHLAPGYPTSTETYVELYDFVHAVGMEFLNAGIDHWPHVRIQLSHPDDSHGPET